MGFLRWTASPPMAALVTAGLFIMMAALIRGPELNLPKPKPYEDVVVTFKPELLEPHPTPIKPTLPALPPTEINPPPRDGAPEGVPFEPPTGPVGETVPGGGDLVISPPLIKHSPQYPQSCSAKGVEGVVIVQFDVTPEGNVINPQIIETVDRCFNRTVLATISKWKYPPARGGAMRRSNVETFHFQLVD